MLNRVQTQDGLSRRTLVTLIVAGLGALSLVLFVLPSDSGFGSGNVYAEEKDLEPVLMLAEEKHKQELIDERHSPTADSKPPAEQGKLPEQELEQKEQKEQEQQHEGWPEACKKLWMTDVDRRAYVDTLVEAKVKQYLEWGGGSSTLCAAALVANVTTIEHNNKWCLKLKQQIMDAKITNVDLVCSPVEWESFGGTPEGDGTYEQFAAYVDAVDHVGMAHYDVVFIDGRARPSCAKKALNYINNESIVMVHDWERPHYQAPMLTAYELQTRFEALARLRKKLKP